MLETQSIPLRNYLMQHVMPTLTEGLIEVCKVKPEDAVDYLVSFIYICSTLVGVTCSINMCIKIFTLLYTAGRVSLQAQPTD